MLFSKQEMDEHFTWDHVKRLYLSGNSPREIARIYPEITERQISNKAYHYKWNELRARIEHEIEAGLELELTEISNMVYQVVKKVLNSYLTDQMPAGHGPVLNTALRLSWPNVALEPQVIERIELVGLAMDIDNV